VHTAQSTPVGCVERLPAGAGPSVSQLDGLLNSESAGASAFGRLTVRRSGGRRVAPGERLPAVAEFATDYGVARGNVVAALRRIEADGLIEILANWGTFRKETD
jgi:hypothetical protein